MEGAILRADGPATRTQVLPIAALEPTPLKAAQAAALACDEWIGRGSPDAADAAAAGNELERMLAAA